jgi:hypothetical protein
MMTISPTLSAGTSEDSVSVAPSMVTEALVPSNRTEEISVLVLQRSSAGLERVERLFICQSKPLLHVWDRRHRAVWFQAAVDLRSLRSTSRTIIASASLHGPAAVSLANPKTITAASGRRSSLADVLTAV